jgi:rubrerythrin
MTIPEIILSYLIVALGALAIAVAYGEFRQRRFQPTPSHDRIFRCAKCGYVYTDDPDVDRSRCSQCGQMNEPFAF